MIDDGGELFGNFTTLKDGSRAANGFIALAEYDATHDGLIDARDPIWSRLLLWTDRNHDGVSTPDEIVPIRESGITGISVGYVWTGMRDRHGNMFRYAGIVFLNGGIRVCYDIYFRAAEPHP